jgi:hypothetical protein
MFNEYSDRWDRPEAHIMEAVEARLQESQKIVEEAVQVNLLDLWILLEIYCHILNLNLMSSGENSNEILKKNYWTKKMLRWNKNR